MRGIRNIQTFIAADALLAVVLLVWAQLWIQPFVQLWAGWFGKEKIEAVATVLGNFNFNVGLGLAWTFLAVIVALFALAWAGWCSIEDSTDKTPSAAVGLFGAAVAMAIINVTQSVFSVIIKLIKHLSIYEPLDLSAYPFWFLVVFGVWAFIVVIATGLLFGYSPTGKWCKFVYMLWLLVGVLYFLIYSLVFLH